MSSILNYMPGIVRDTHAYLTKEDPTGAIKQKIISRVESAAFVALTAGCAVLASYAIGAEAATIYWCFSLIMLSPASFVLMGAGLFCLGGGALIANAVGTASLGAGVVSMAIGLGSLYMEEDMPGGVISLFGIINPFTGRPAFQRA